MKELKQLRLDLFAEIDNLLVKKLEEFAINVQKLDNVQKKYYFNKVYTREGITPESRYVLLLIGGKVFLYNIVYQTYFTVTVNNYHTENKYTRSKFITFDQMNAITLGQASKFKEVE
jgi:hypothetical protein